MPAPYEHILAAIATADNLDVGTAIYVLRLTYRALRPNGIIHPFIEGYDDDPRELWEIPEVAVFFKALWKELDKYPEIVTRIDQEFKDMLAVVSMEDYTS